LEEEHPSTRRMLVLLSQLLFVASASAVIFDSFSALPETDYDFVIVGGESLSSPTLSTQHTHSFWAVIGGNAGAVVANRLSEIAQWNVLVIEAGPT
jgi:hypothetical protein